MISRPFHEREFRFFQKFLISFCLQFLMRKEQWIFLNASSWLPSPVQSFLLIQTPFYPFSDRDCSDRFLWQVFPAVIFFSVIHLLQKFHLRHYHHWIYPVQAMVSQSISVVSLLFSNPLQTLYKALINDRCHDQIVISRPENCNI